MHYHPIYNNYYATEDGSVFNKKTNRKLKPHECKNQYKYIKVSKNGNQKLVLLSRFIMQCFYGFSELDVNHKNGNKDDNSINNLEYVTKSENCFHREQIIKTGTSKEVECLETKIRYSSTKQASVLTGINQSNICQCALKNRKTAGGYHWEYVNGGANVLS